MAKSNNLPAKRYKAGERTERTLRFAWAAGNDGDVRYIDIAKALSAVNRRAYRQGLYYYVAKATFVNGSDAHCQINTIPDTWMTKVSWIRAFKIWSKMNAIASAESGGMIYPKYHDFKTQMINGVTILDPVSADFAAAVTYDSDEWVTSKFVSDDPGTTDPQTVDIFVSHMLGNTVAGGGAPDVHASVGLIRSAQDTWLIPQAVEPRLDGDMDTDPLANLFDAGDSHDDIRLNLDQDNDATPYDADAWTGAASVHEVSTVATARTSAGAGARSIMDGFCAPLGLLEIDVTDFGSGASTVGNVELILELVPGTYHGVYAERIL